MSKKQWGGAREGSGPPKKPDDEKRRTIHPSVSKDSEDYLASFPLKMGEVVDALIGFAQEKKEEFAEFLLGFKK